MPKNTFYNLDESKRQVIFRAAVVEFSTHRFSDASINRIIKTAGIPRGSFYQYFVDKQDIFLHVFEEILKEKQEILRNATDVNPEANVFDLCLQTVKASYEWSRARPEYSQISMLMEIDNSGFIANLRATSAKELKDVVERDKGRGLIRREIDSDLIVEMIYTLIIKEGFWIGLDRETFLRKISDVITVIKDGIARR